MHEIHLETVDSTNTYAKLHKIDFPKNEITCVVANEQTGGRGRFQRKWISPKDVNLYITFYFTLPTHFPGVVSLSQLMAYSFATLLAHVGLFPKIKWPNDIQLNGKKVSGILSETQFQKENIDIFLGIGINVNLEDASPIDQPATSLFLETGKKWERIDLLKKLQTQFSQDLEKFKREGFSPFHAEFEKMLAFKGEKIQCFDGKKTWTGRLHSITKEGQLNLELDDQTIQTISSGDLLS